MALTKAQRIPLFLIGCMGTRLALVYAALVAPSLVLSVFTGIIGMGFAIIWLLGLRKTGLETGGEKIWWNHLRPIHAVLFLTVSVLLWYGMRKWAAILLFLDLLIGLVSFLIHHKFIDVSRIM
jgi:hypothetical protein